MNESLVLHSRQSLVVLKLFGANAGMHMTISKDCLLLTKERNTSPYAGSTIGVLLCITSINFYIK